MLRRLLPEPGDEPVSSLYDGLVLDAGSGDRAHVALNMVTSVDGATAWGGRSGPLGGPADELAFSRLRATCDAVLVGAGTVRAEDYRIPTGDTGRREARLTAGLAAVPRLLVVSGSLDFPPDARFLQPPTGVDGVAAEDCRAVIVTHGDAPADRVEALTHVAEVVRLGEQTVDLPGLLRWCAGRGWPRVLCEGGPTLNGELIAADLVDEVFVTIAPKLVAGTSSRFAFGPQFGPPRDLDLVEARHHDGELLLRYRRRS